MKDPGKALSVARFLIPILTASPLLSPVMAQSAGSTRYVVLQVSAQDGKVFHKAMADKDQDGFRKSQEEDYQKAKRSLQDEKKDFQKKHPGEKFEKTEPKKPAFHVVKRDIKSYNEALKVATDLDREREKSKNGKSAGGKSASGGNGKADSGKSDSGKGESGKSESGKSESGKSTEK